MRAVTGTGLMAVMIMVSALAGFGQHFPGGKWRLVSYDLGAGVQRPAAGQDITFNVDREGGVGGNTGCNVFGGEYTYARREFRIGDLIQTMRACEDPTPGFERDYLDVLRSATEFRVRKTMLFVEDKKTHWRLSFVQIFGRD